MKACYYINFQRKNYRHKLMMQQALGIFLLIANWAITFRYTTL